MSVLRKTYLWDLLEPAATRILAMSLFDETGTWAENLYSRTTCWKTPRRSSASERDAAPCTNTARMGILSGWKGMPQRTIRSGFPANTLMTNWGWFTTITVIIIPKMAGGLVEILPKKKKLTIYIGLSEIIRQYIWHIGKTMSRYVMGTTSCYGRIYKAHWKLF